jgi:hypothetical protein
MARSSVGQINGHQPIEGAFRACNHDAPKQQWRIANNGVAELISYLRERGLIHSACPTHLRRGFDCCRLHSYIFIPTREMCPASSVNSRRGISIPGHKHACASAWLDGSGVAAASRALGLCCGLARRGCWRSLTPGCFSRLMPEASQSSLIRCSLLVTGGKDSFQFAQAR